jgi:hypothetical protein
MSFRISLLVNVSGCLICAAWSALALPSHVAAQPRRSCRTLILWCSKRIAALATKAIARKETICQFFRDISVPRLKSSATPVDLTADEPDKMLIADLQTKDGQ